MARLKTIIRVVSYRHLLKGNQIHIKKPHIRYYHSSLDESVQKFAHRILSYWQVENKVHCVHD